MRRYGKLSELTARHDLPYHVVGSDLAGVVLRTGPGVNVWKPGEEVVAHCLSVELESSDGHNDTMMDPEQRIWGFETNFGGLAELAIVKTNQLMPKPKHLTWEEAATPGLVNSTAFRQLVSRNGAGLKQGDNVLIWGASGGLGAYATQYALAGGAIPVCVVSSKRKAELCRSMGAELIIDRSAEDYRFWKDEHTQDPKEWKRLGSRIRDLTGGEDVDIVFEHPGRETFGASVYVTRRGGTIVTCASTSGFMHEYDNRYLWMSLKRIIGSHFANYREAWQANRLISKGMIHPTMSVVYPLADTGQAAMDVHRNLHHGKVGVLCLAPREGLGVRDPELRARHLTEINRFRNLSSRPGARGNEAGMTEPSEAPRAEPARRPARDRPWLMRTYAGHSSAAESNALYRRNLAKGQTGLSVAFDLPTQTGYDADHVLARGEVGRVGVPVGHLGDMRALFAGIPLERTNTSMTINATAMWLLALYQVVAEEQGADIAALTGTTQNDIVKEYLARGTYVFPPGPSVRLTTDVIAYTVARMPKWNPINVCSYHLQEAGATPVQEIAYALCTAMTVLDAVRDGGQVAPGQMGEVVGRMSFFVNAGVRFVEEMCKMRAFSRLWDTITRQRYGIGDPALRRFRYGVQVNSLGLTEAQPENNVQRIVLEMLAVTLFEGRPGPGRAAARLERGAGPAPALGPAVEPADPAGPRVRVRPAGIR